MSSIPNPLRSGNYTLSNSTYTGDVGSTDPNNQPVLTLSHNAVANVTVEGLGDQPPESAFGHYATFDVKGRDTLNLTLGGGRFSPYGPGFATVNLQPGARLGGTLSTTLDGFLTVNGGHGSRLVDYSGTMSGGSAVIRPDLQGSGTVTLSGGGPLGTANLELGGRVSRGETIKIEAANLLLDKPMQFLGTIDWAPLTAPNFITLAGVHADSYSLQGGELHLFKGNHDFLDLKLTQESAAAPKVFQSDHGVVLSDIVQSGSTALPQHIGSSLPHSQAHHLHW